MDLDTIVTKRPKLSLQFGGIMNRPSAERHDSVGTLSPLDLKRIVADMVG